MAEKEPINVAVVGARGYSGLELTRLLLRHPRVRVSACLASDSNWKMSDYLPEDGARGVPVLPIESLAEMTEDLDVVFLATPAEASIEYAPGLLRSGVDVIDLSGAFRLPADAFAQWYGKKHTAAEWIAKAEYGLVPWAGPASPVGPRLVANPGCYATAALMGLLPLLKDKIVDPQSIVIDAKSGTSGAGRKATESLLFNEVDGEFAPYRVGAHQHYPEIVRFAKALGGQEIAPHFVTELLPVRRGISAAIFAKLARGIGEEEVGACYQHHYEREALVRCGTCGKEPALLGLRRVVGSARTHITWHVTNERLYVFALIDNLLKGAASQAVENLNRLLGLPPASHLAGLEGVL